MKHTLLFVSLILSSLFLSAQDATKSINLLPEKSPLSLSHIHITAVLDTCADTSKIAILQTGLTGKKSTILQLQPNLRTAIHQFIKTNYTQNTSTTPIQLHITRLEITHHRTGFKSRAHLSFGLAFYTQGRKITDYNGDASFDGTGDPTQTIEELIRQTLNSSLCKFDTWWATNKARFLASAGAPLSITVQAAMAQTTTDSDMIAYSQKRPLQLDDFSGTVDHKSSGSAVTHSGIQLHVTSQIKDGHLKVHVSILPYFDKNRSWCRKINRNARTLAHEQRHFDITAIKACELLQTIQTFTFTSNFMKELDLLHQKNEDEWDTLQRQYDTETKHGQATKSQQLWDNRIRG
jgi:Homoserine trans-succinylase